MSHTRLMLAFAVLWLPSMPPAIASRPCAFPDTYGPRATPNEAGQPMRFLSDVRAGMHRCFDRVTFEFRPGRDSGVGYRAEYVEKPVREDGSSRPVDVDGEAVIVVRMAPAHDVKFSGGEARPTYQGPQAVSPPGGTRIMEARHISSFEGAVKWAIGVDRQRPFRVRTFASPPRLVIDVG